MDSVGWIDAWSELDKLDIVNGSHVYYGHDAVRGLQQHALTTGLDTGCCYGRSLSAMMLPSKRLVQVDALNVYEVPGRGKKPIV